MIKRLLQILLIFFVMIFSTALGIMFYVTQQPWVDFTILEHYNPGKPSILYDAEGTEWTRFQLDKRQPIRFKTIPTQVINAFIAAEDWNFFKHSGLSIKGIIRSLVVNLSSRRKAQGASTITQQLVRLLFFDSEKSFKRKIKEQLLAIIVERQFSKEQILETYLNHTYFGSGIYGIGAASNRFWGKQVQELSLDQAAILASIVQLPQKYCPLYHQDATLIRRNVILNKMYKLGMITNEEYSIAKEKPIILKEDASTLAPHLKETIRLFLEELVGKQKLYSGGLKIQTTINLKMQESAEQIFKKYFNRLRKNISPNLEGALIAINGNTGAIKAMIGGYNFQQSQFNRAVKAQRQMGSTFKPLVYYSAIANGKSLADVEIDEPITLKDNNKEWSPRNSNHSFDGSMTLAKALLTSNNIIAIKTFLKSNPNYIISLAKKCGLKNNINPYPSLALGCTDSTLQEVACFINIFAHNGILVEPHYLLFVKDEWGTKIWKNKTVNKRVLNPKICNQIAKLLTINISKAQKSNPARWFDGEALGKTGTTNDARTCWFTGSTPEITTAVYIGNDNNKALGKNIFASQTALPIWREFNKAIANNKIPTQHFEYDKDLKEITINATTGNITSNDDPQAITILVE